MQIADYEPIEFSKYPIWEMQDDEESEAFIKFTKYYLVGTKPSLTPAWRRWLDAEQNDLLITDSKSDQNSDTNTSTNRTIAPRNDTPTGQWRRWERLYRWQERHRAYWQDRLQRDLAWQEHQQKECTAKMLGTINKLLDRANELASLPTVTVDNSRTYPDGRPYIQVITPQSSKAYVDAVTVLKESVGLINNLGCTNDLEKAINTTIKAGLEVIDRSLLSSDEPTALLEPDDG